MEEFQDYWLNHHGKLFSSLAVVKRNVLKYEQVSTPPPTPLSPAFEKSMLTLRRWQFHINSKLTEPIVAQIPGYVPPPYSGMAIFEAESMEKIFEIFTDEEYLRLVRPDEEKFISLMDAKFTAGTFATFIGA